MQRPDDSGPGGSAPDGPDDSDPDGGGPDDGGGPPPRPGGQAPDDRGEARPGTAQDPGQRQAARRPGAPEAARGQSASGATAPFRPRLLTVTGIGQGAPGRRSAARTPYGRVTGARLPHGRVHSVHLPATLRAAAPRAGRARQKSLADRAAAGRQPAADRAATGRQPSADGRGSSGGGSGGDAPSRIGRPHRRPRGPRLRIRASDLRETVRVGREGNLVLFAVDASGSMAAGHRMRAVKGAVLSLLLDAYQRRDKVGLVTFRGAAAELALPPTSSVEAGARRLAVLPTGGRTPLAAGLTLAARVLRAERLRDPDRRPLLVIVTDGRATSGSAADLTRACTALAGVAAIVVDCESGPVRLGLAVRLAAQLDGRAVRLEELAADSLTGVVRAHAPAGLSAGHRRGAA